MTKPFRIVMAQLNFHLGDIQGNTEKHIAAAIEARDKLSAEMIVFPELSLTGYSPDDLLFRQDFIKASNHGLKQIQQAVKGIYCLVGHPQHKHHNLYNACSMLYNGKIIAEYSKRELPNYGVFDEQRYFTSGNEICVIPIHDIPIGIVICEDIWRLHPVHDTAAKGAKLIIAMNASPFESNKHEQRLDVLQKRATHDQVPIMYINHFSGQDEIVFDGGSMVVNAEGELVSFAGFHQEALHPVDIHLPDLTIKPDKIKIPPTINRIYQTLVTGLRDYIHKNNFKNVILGLSGGIDSALTACIAVDALGKNHVKGILLPSRHTDTISNEDAIAIGANLDIATESFSIEPAYQALIETLSTSIKENSLDITHQNLQARCRGILLMALSNHENALLLTTGNRSELAVGYCTLYGDMAGGFAVLKDVPKTLVYELATYRNSLSQVVPQRTIDREPTAELAPNQKDQDSLPPYDVLDKILELYLNQTKSINDICDAGFDKKLVEKVVRLIHQNEYKRTQAAIGTHINHKSFRKDWRFPLTNGFKG